MPNTMPAWLASPYHMPTNAFVTKLRFLVDDPKFDDAIAWTQDGQAIIIRSVDLFVEKVLCSTFKTSNFSSFVRQLNMYGFSKVNGYTKLVNGRRLPMIFRNASFVQDNPKLMMKLQRMPLKNKEWRLSVLKNKEAELEKKIMEVPSDKCFKACSPKSLAKVPTSEIDIKPRNTPNLPPHEYNVEARTSSHCSCDCSRPNTPSMTSSPVSNSNSVSVSNYCPAHQQKILPSDSFGIWTDQERYADIQTNTLCSSQPHRGDTYWKVLVDGNGSAHTIWRAF